MPHSSRLDLDSRAASNVVSASMSSTIDSLHDTLVLKEVSHIAVRDGLQDLIKSTRCFCFHERAENVGDLHITHLGLRIYHVVETQAKEAFI